MIPVASSVRIWLATGHTDMRRGMPGLAFLVQEGFVSPEVYTPSLVVDGRLDAVGSDGIAVDLAFAQAARSEHTAAAVDVQQGPARIAVSVDGGRGAGTLLLVGYDRLHRTTVGRGENGGRTLEEANIVRSMSVLGPWTGRPIRLEAAYPVG